MKHSRQSLLLASKENNNNDDDSELYVETVKDLGKRAALTSAIAGSVLVSSMVAGAQLYNSQVSTPAGFQRVPLQYIAALGDPTANSGGGADAWGLWRQDPGPRGVWLRDYEANLKQSNFVAPNGWTFNPADWWLEEHGLIMEAPVFPVPPGRYLVTGNRAVTTGLTIQEDGSWKLDDDNAKLYDVTHLPCRSARYRPTKTTIEKGMCGPSSARPLDFPVRPGAEMPDVAGCDKVDYAVLFLIGKAV
jgi:hypothetical protein